MLLVLLGSAAALSLGRAGSAGGRGANRPVLRKAVGLDEVAVPDRGARADDRNAGETAAPPPKGGHSEADRAPLALLAEGLRTAWRSIPAYSPVNAQSRLSSGFGWRASPFTGRREFHGGVDLAAERGTEVVAPADGIVERAYWETTAGWVVILEHGNSMETLYGHLDRILVQEGQDIARGQAIGVLGSTGRRSTGPHLHYAIKVERKYVNPRRYLFETQDLRPRAVTPSRKRG